MEENKQTQQRGQEQQEGRQRENISAPHPGQRDEHPHTANDHLARQGHSGEGDRTDTEEMHGLNENR